MSRRRGLRKHQSVVVAISLPVLLVGPVVYGGSAIPAPVQVPEARDAAEEERAFGFRVREERRYALGPPGILAPGESEQWIIRLESIDDEDPSAAPDLRTRRVRFRLEHEATQIARGGALFGGASMTSFHGIMSLVVNGYGFPLRTRYWADRDDPRVAGSREESTLLFDVDQFRILNPYRMGLRDLGLDLPPGDFIDVSVPRGAYLAGYENPGLYTLILANAGIREAGEVEYVAVAPSLFAASGKPRGAEGGVLTRAWLRFDGHTMVDLGGVRTPAMRLKRSGGGDLFVQEDGTVLRVDITLSEGRNAWLRLLRPSEY